MTSPPRPRINVTIDQLVLRGFPADRRDAIAAALAAELRQQWTDPGAIERLGAGRSLELVRARPISLAADAKPQQAGAEAGRAIARSIQS